MKPFKGLILFLGIALLILGVPTGAPGRAAGSGAGHWKLVWHDEFNGADGSGVDRRKWNCDVGTCFGGIKGLQVYTDKPANVSLNGGCLVIRAIRETVKGYEYTSGLIETKGKFQFRYGRVEARMKVPCAKGVVPSLSLIGNTGKMKTWPDCGQIDVAYNIGQDPTSMYGAAHGPGFSGLKSLWKPYRLPVGQTIPDGFHVYALEWEADVLRWYVDGHLYHEVTGSCLPTGSPWVFDHPYYLVLQLLVGGVYAGDPDSSTPFPQAIAVDYLRVYQR